MNTIDNFYELNTKLVSSTFNTKPIWPLHQEKESDINWKLINGEYRSTSFPITFKQYMGKRLHDIIETGWPSRYLISSKMKKILENNNLTGWNAYEVIVLDKKNNIVPDYHGLSITGRCGPIDNSKAEIIKKRLVSTGPICSFYKGFYVGLDKWDGTDFFLPDGYFGIIISPKAAKILIENKLTNVVLENLSDYESSVRE